MNTTSSQSEIGVSPSQNDGRSRPLEQRFWEKVSPEPMSGCWLWTGSWANGYGDILVNGKVQRAHRVAWQLLRGPIPVGQHVLHRCDTPPCVNPSHLFLGTALDNITDMVTKGRNEPCRGERNGRAKLSATAVTTIRARVAAGETQRALAREYGMHYQTIYYIVNRKLWSRNAEYDFVTSDKYPQERDEETL